MLNKKQLSEEVEFVGTLKMLSQAYEEVAVIKMQRVRSSVLTTREFITQLSEVFTELKHSYHRQIEAFAKAKKKDKGKQTFTTFNKNGKTVAVFISANDKLYGDIVTKVSHSFIDFMNGRLGKPDVPDVIIVGKSGKGVYDQHKDLPPYTFFDVPDAHVTLDHIQPVVKKMLEYEKVYVFYGKFVNVMSQEATMEDISGEQELAEEEKDKDGKVKIKYFFEPSLEKILQFFEGSVFTSFFTQTIHETELARLASRIRAMEEALGNIEKSEMQLKGEERRLKRSLSNKKQLEGLAGIALLK